MTRPLILLSNDDGIDSSHLTQLADRIAGRGDVDLIVVAPERERSATSQSITLHKPLRIDEVAPNRFSVSGSPVDCVYLGLLKLCDRPATLVISGLNRGYNLGSDVFYSGTVAAAVEGALRGIPAVALSLAAPERNPDPALHFANSLVTAVLEHPLPDGTLLNVNVPPGAPNSYCWTRLGNRVYRDLVDERHDPRGRPYYWIGGGVEAAHNPPGTDCHAVAVSQVSVTPLHLDLTAHAVVDDNGAWAIGDFDDRSESNK